MSTPIIADQHASWQVNLDYDIPHSTSEMNKWCEKSCTDWWIYLGTAYMFGNKDDAVAFYMTWG